MSFFQRWAVPLKLLYFFINVQYFAFYNFRGNFALNEFKISKENFGQIFGIILAVCFFTNSFIATLFDKFEKPKLFITLLLLISMGCFELFYLLPAAAMHTSIFWLIMFAYSFFSTGIPALLDRFAIDYLANNPHTCPRSYGRQRLWGTVGYVFSNFVVESIIRPDGVFDFSKLVYYLPIVTVPALLCTLFTVRSYERETRSTRDVENSWGRLLRNRQYMFFIFIIFMNGVTRAGMTMYLSIFLDEVLKLKKYELSTRIPGYLRVVINLFNSNPLSVTATCGVVLEILIFVCAQRIVGHFGLYWPLLMAQVAQFLRFFGYWALPYDNKNVFLWSCLLETMKGVNFGLTHSSGVQIANNLCPPNLKATSQMIYTGTFTGIASFFSGQIFGLLFSRTLNNKDASIGERAASFDTFFEVNMVISFLCVLLFLGKYGLIDKTLSLDVFRAKKKEEKINQTEIDVKKGLSENLPVDSK